jgi:DNA mismatch endonuclease (patch repair protein)
LIDGANERRDSLRMSITVTAIQGRATKRERAVRAALLQLGERFECNVQGIPGTPDIVLCGNRAIFVHGCFVHAHDCPRGRIFGAHAGKWRLQQAKNVARDLATCSVLADRMHWRLLTVWECETKNFDAIKKKLHAFLKA